MATKTVSKVTLKKQNEKINENLIRAAKRNMKAIKFAEARLEKIKAILEPIIIEQGESHPTDTGGTTWVLRAGLDIGEVTISFPTRNNTKLFEAENPILVKAFNEKKAEYNYRTEQTTIKFK